MKAKKILYLIVLSFICFHISRNSNAAPSQRQEALLQSEIDVDVDQLHYLTTDEKEKITKNGFVIFIPKRTTYYPEDEALSIYLKCKESHFPVFVTSDIILHTSHLLFDWSLRFLEISYLKQDLLNITDAMGTCCLNYYDQIDNENKKLKEAALKNAIFFNIAKSLLTETNLEEVPEEIKQIIEKEINLIDKHEGFELSPLFGYKEDYSQYLARGHYSRSPEFEKYFKAMMWYGRMAFRLSPVKEVDGKYVLDEEVGIDETLQALLICKALTETKVKGEKALTVWERIYETTGFFAGKADDLTVKEYQPLIDELYNNNLPFSYLTDGKKITEFVIKARQLRKPNILSTYITDVSARSVDWKTQIQGFRFLGQRFTPDAHIFQNLVYDKVKWYTGEDPKPFTAVFANGAWFRGLPRGLDVMAVFGSQMAEQILGEEKESHFQQYEDQLSQLKKQYSFTNRDIWTQDLYCSRIWALKSILQIPPENAPFFMQSDAWQKKQLNTALGSWAELKHDTIIYTKQPYAMAQSRFSVMGKGGPIRRIPPETVHGYVEPVPELYARVRESVTQLRLKLTSLEFPSDKALEYNFKAFEELLNALESISKKELSGEIPTDSEYKLIENIGHNLRRILHVAHYMDVTEKFRSEMDNKMPIIADVFAEVNTKEALEEAVGKPAEIFVITKVDGKQKVCLGAAYSYYEFKQPMTNRLTDEKWREMLKENKQPPIPEWFQDIALARK